MSVQAPAPTVLPGSGSALPLSGSKLPPEAPSDLHAELSFLPAGTRLDPAPGSAPLKLETRGVTSQRKDTETTLEAAAENRRIAAEADRRQRRLYLDRVALKETLIHKLRERGADEPADALAACHQHLTFQRCKQCHNTAAYYNRCERFYCPICQPRLARERRQSVMQWTMEVRHPKHVVLTTRNTDTICRESIQLIKDQFSRLRRTVFCTGTTIRTETDRDNPHFGRTFTSHRWRGGFYSLEITNEGRGWHLHIHALVDSQFIDAKSLAILWARLTGQDFAIVKVKDASGKEYLQELCKYVVDGNEIANWASFEVAAYVNAFTNVRTFGVFGSLFKMRAAKAKAVAAILDPKQICPCGCDSFDYYTEQEWEWKCLTADPPAGPSGNISPAPAQMRFSTIAN